jgi:hypothetical protein
LPFCSSGLLLLQTIDYGLHTYQSYPIGFWWLELLPWLGEASLPAPTGTTAGFLRYFLYVHDNFFRFDILLGGCSFFYFEFFRRRPFLFALGK